MAAQEGQLTKAGQSENCPEQEVASSQTPTSSQTEIHRGRHSVVTVLTTKNGSRVVAKAVASPETLAREVAVLGFLPGHPNLIRYYGLYKGQLLFEYGGESLYDYVEREQVVSERIAISIFSQLAQGLWCLHRHGVAHLDLKLENVLLQGRSVKLIDFGLARFFEVDQPYSDGHRGSYEYMGPEMLFQEPYLPARADIWALGVTLYTFLFGRFPYQVEISKLLCPSYRYSLRRQMESLSFTMGSMELRSLMGGLLEPDPFLRPPVWHLLEHAWFVSRPLSPRDSI